MVDRRTLTGWALAAGSMAACVAAWTLLDPHRMSLNCWPGAEIPGVVSKCIEDGPYAPAGFVPIAKARIASTIARRGAQ